MGNKSIEFTTSGIPKNGIVMINPMAGTIGDDFTVSIANWTSNNASIFYNVFNTTYANSSVTYSTIKSINCSSK